MNTNMTNLGQLTNMTDNSDPAGPTDITWTGGNLTTILSRYYVGAEEYYNLTRYVYDLKTAAKNGDYWYGRNVWDADGYGQEASPFHSKNSVRQVITRTYWRTSFGGDQLVAYNHTVIWPKFDVNKNIVEVVETTPAQADTLQIRYMSYDCLYSSVSLSVIIVHPKY